MSYTTARKYIRRLVPAAMVIATMLALSGCTDIDGDLASERDVLNEVKEVVPSEGYELVSVDHDTEARPKVDTYHFQSKKRDLKFDAVSTLAAFGIDGGVIGYNEHIYVEYPEAVREQYRDSIEQVLAPYPVNQYGKHQYNSFLDLNGVADALMECDSIYREELKYNKADWLKANPFGSVMFAYPYYDENGDKKELYTFSVSIDGTLSRDDLYDQITYDHVRNCVKQGVADPYIPADQYSRVHQDRLSIQIGYVNVSEKGPEVAHEKGLYNNIDSAYECAYYYDWDKYVMPLNLGLTDEQYAPQLVEMYCEALGYPYSIEYEKGRVSWSTGSDDWEIRADDNRHNEITKFDVYRNGTRVAIPCVRTDDNNSPGGAMYCVYVAVDDFADMFGVTYDIDENAGFIVFNK